MDYPGTLIGNITTRQAGIAPRRIGGNLPGFDSFESVRCPIWRGELPLLPSMWPLSALLCFLNHNFALTLECAALDGVFFEPLLLPYRNRRDLRGKKIGFFSCREY